MYTECTQYIKTCNHGQARPHDACNISLVVMIPKISYLFNCVMLTADWVTVHQKTIRLDRVIEVLYIIIAVFICEMISTSCTACM